jgi:hypothetical protein
MYPSCNKAIYNLGTVAHKYSEMEELLAFKAAKLLSVD